MTDKLKDYTVWVRWDEGPVEASTVMVVTASSKAGACKKAIAYADKLNANATATIMETR